MNYYELSIDRPNGVLRCRIVAKNEQQARHIAGLDDAVWRGPLVRVDKFVPNAAVDELLGLKKFIFEPCANCPTCGK